MLILNNLLLTFKDRTLFDNLRFSVDYHEKIGLLGRNGSGKSTLLKVIAGYQQLDSGSVTYDKKKKIGYLPQELILQSNKSVFDETMTVFSTFLHLQDEAHTIEQELEISTDPVRSSELIEQYSTIQEKLTHFDAAAAVTKADTILNGLGFSQKQRNQTVDSLSVGWKMRVVLAKLLLQDADFYLFDEPTNHLDLPAKEWFLSLLKDAQFGYLLVSHDRYFLEKACEKIIEIERGSTITYKGNFDSYLAQKQENQDRLLAAYTQQQKEISRKKETINKFRSKASKAAMVRSMIKELDKMEQIEIEPTLPKLSFSFNAVTRAGNVVLTLENVSHAFGTTELFKNLSCIIMRGKKVALIAPNGMGKTTLFNLIAGKLLLQHGSVEFGHNVTTAYFEQDQTRVMNKNHTVLQEVSDACSNVPEMRIRSFLGSFLFSGETVQKKIGQLSGGEKNRVAMVKVLLQNSNMLLLDEPTNHLDLHAKDVLQQALQQYKGTILFVSHDHDFIQHVADTILELTPTGLHLHNGDYESYLYHKQAAQQAIAKKKSTPHKKEPSENLNQQRHLKKQLNAIEVSIQKLETKRNALGERLSNLTYGTQEYTDTLSKLTAIDQRLAQKNNEWEQSMKQITQITT